MNTRWVIPLGLFLAAIPGSSFGQVPAHLEILSAQVIETGKPKHFLQIKGRKVSILIELARKPKCSDGPLEYGILIDADQDPDTGQRDEALSGAFGLDALAFASCDPDNPKLSSPLGRVKVKRTKEGTALVEIKTRVNKLPSVQFNWIAFAQGPEGFVRVPSGDLLGFWAIFEIISY